MTDMQGLADQLNALNEDAIESLVHQLGSAGALTRFTTAIEAYDSRRGERAVLDAVRVELAREGVTDVVGVVFTPDEWDDGFYLNHQNAIVWHRDDTGVQCTWLELDVSSELTSWFGRVPRLSALAVRPQQGDTFYDDYEDNVFGWLGVERPWINAD